MHQDIEQHKKMSAKRCDGHKVVQRCRQHTQQTEKRDDPFKCQANGQSSLFKGNRDPTQATIDGGWDGGTIEGVDVGSI